MNNHIPFENKTVVITGANRGIGLAILKRFAVNGANIIACARNESEEFAGLIAQLSSLNSISIKSIYFDMENSADVKEAGYQIARMDCGIDALINNAGIASGGFFQMTSIDEMRKLFEINFFSQIALSQIISRKMMRNKMGSIINIASNAGLIGGQGMLAYGSSKAALILATKVMATELGKFNIRVNAIAPTVTKTDMYDQMEEKAREKLRSSSALGRPANPDEVANTALFLASELSSYINGQIICMDGGVA